MDLEPLLETDGLLNETTLNVATDYVLKLYEHLEDFKARKTIHYESNPVVYAIYNPFLNLNGSLLLYRRLSGKIVLQMIYEAGK